MTHLTLRRLNYRDVARRLLCAGGLTALLLLVGRAAPAHEGHAELPTKGLTVEGDQLLLSEGARAAIDIETEKVTLADMQSLVECNARIELPWQRQAMITTQVPGRIGQVLVRPGQSVKAGQQLASVESLELESMQLNMLQVSAELALAEEQLSRQRSLAQQGAIAGSAALDTEATVRQRKAELEVAMCKLRALGLSQQLIDQVRDTERPVPSIAIISPIAGIVAEADVRTGQLVKTTEHLFHVVDLSTLWAVGDVLEGEVAKVQVGQPATVEFKSLPGRTFTGTIDHLHLTMDEKRRTRAVAVALDNQEGLLKPGMFGQMQIETGRSEQAIVAPPESLIRYFGEEFVLLNRGEGKYLRRSVEVGLRNDQRVEILGGLFPGDQVTVNGNHVLFSLFANDTPAQPSAESKALSDSASMTSTAASPTTSEVGSPIVVQGTVEIPIDQKALAGSRIEGRVGRILVRHSEPVQAGDVLAEVESLELRNVQGELLETQSKLAWTSERVDRLESLARQNVTSKKELWQLQTQERVLQNKVASLTRQLTMIGVSESQVQRVLQTDLSAEDCDLSLLKAIPIRAAIDGAVSAFDIVPGQIVDAQDTLFKIHDTSTVWVKGYLFQQDATNVKTGQQVSVTFHALPGVTVEGTVVRISPVLNSSERVLPLWVEVDNQDGRLIEGMLARIEINAGSSPLAVMPPNELRP